MAIINKINLDFAKDFAKDIFELSSKIRASQEELEHLKSQIKDNESYFSTGKISKKIWEKNKTMLEEKKQSLSSKINKSVEEALKIIESIQSKIKENKI